MDGEAPFLEHIIGGGPHCPALACGSTICEFDGNGTGLTAALLGPLLALLGDALPGLGNIAGGVEGRPGGGGFDYAEIVVSQQVIQIELVVSLALTESVGAVFDQRLSVGLLGGAEGRAPGLALMQCLQVLIIEIVEIALGHIGQAVLAIDAVIGDDGRGSKRPNALAVEGGGGEIARHPIAVQAGPAIQIIGIAVQHTVNGVHIEEGDSLLLAIFKYTLVDVVPLAVAVDQQFHRPFAVFLGQVVLGEAAQHIGVDRVLTILISVQAIGHIQNMEFLVRPLQEPSHLIGVGLLGKNGVGEIH